MERIILVQEEPRTESQLVEIPIAAGVSSVTFPDIPELRSDTNVDVIVKGIRLITAKVLTNGVITGTAATPRVDLLKISVVIYADGWQKAQYIPVLVLNDVADADATTATTIPFRYNATKFADWRITWNKCKLQFSQGTTSAGASVLMLDVEYSRFDRDGKMIIGPAV